MRISGRLGKRRLLAAGVDAMIVLVAYYLALVFRFAGEIPPQLSYHGASFLTFAPLAVVAHLVTNRFGRVYRIVNRYIGLVQALHVTEACVMAASFLFLVSVFWPGASHLVPLSVVVVGGLGTASAMVGVRFYGRIFHERSLINVGAGRRLLLVGAGQAADMIIREIQRNLTLRTRTHVVGLVDDDPYMQGMRLHQHPVLGTVEDVPQLVSHHDVSEVLVAIPSATSEQMARIHELVRPAGIPIKTLPNLASLMDGTVRFADARDLDIHDLLGRPKVEIDMEGIASYLRGRRVMVTGAGGSIGSELSLQIAGFGPAELALVDRDESALYRLHENLKSRGRDNYFLIPADVLDRSRIAQLLAEYRPHVVFHAAAFKHVPLMELHPAEAVLNNVKGMRIVAEEAARYEVERLVNISTDKAVDPVNVMGATKRVAEGVLRALAARHPRTRFCSVRFGNVLGSRGSVVPIFRRQIADGGPVTVTHPEMTRYFMMIDEAVQLVLQAVALTEEIPAATGGGCYGAFVLEMGEPVKIVDLARQMIEFSREGRSAEIPMTYSGLRPGEKLHEELLCTGERAAPTSHSMVRLAVLAETNPPGVAGGNGAGSDGRGAAGNNGADGSDHPNPSALPSGFATDLDHLIALAEAHAGAEEIIPALKAVVPTYEPFDWTQVGQFPGVPAGAAPPPAAPP